MGQICYSREKNLLILRYLVETRVKARERAAMPRYGKKENKRSTEHLINLQ